VPALEKSSWGILDSGRRPMIFWCLILRPGFGMDQIGLKLANGSFV
jgi:hypothetical protein